ncbi:pyridoxal 5'-phosphate synthase glutaminase subunit PdxT [bacterium]|nr:pyridoxal 5'-phosphate synthase glutaminase subunit PdxT [bacterium]
MRVGVLAVQGDYAKHVDILKRLGHIPHLVRIEAELNQCDGLIIPGGESTTLTIVMQKHGLWEPLRRFGERRPIFGTCAGLIILSSRTPNHPFAPLGLIDLTVERNAYGRQKDSFIDEVAVTWKGRNHFIPGFFIRAPKIIEIGKSVSVLGRHHNDIVLVENERILAATFHPELTDDLSVHKYFIRKLSSSRRVAVVAGLTHSAPG